MCIPDGSVQLYTSTCPMCVVFRHSTRCPHKRETCRNRAAHPRHDVSYIANAEVQTFNGCGFCKWAKQLPPPPAGKTGMSNPGWPGCCRPPAPAELALIPPADWPAVHTIHRTPIPPEVKAILDAVRIPYAPVFALTLGAFSPTSPTGQGTSSASSIAASGFGSTTSLSPTSAIASGAGSLALRERERKSLVRANSSPSAPGVGAGVSGPAPPAAARTGIANVSAAVAIPVKARERGADSPQSRPSSLGGSGAGAGAASGTRAASCERTGQGVRRGPDKPLKRVEGFRTTPPSSMRKLAEAEFHDRALVGAKKDGESAPTRRASNAGTPLRSSAGGAAASLRLTPKAAHAPEKAGETRSRSSSKSHTLAHRQEAGEKARGEMLDLEKIVAALSVNGAPAAAAASDKHTRSQSASNVSAAKALVSPLKNTHAPDKARSEIADDKVGTSAADKSVKAGSVSGAPTPAEKLAKAGSTSSSASVLSNDDAKSTRSDARSVSSNGSGSGDGSTITSDGGFTDYLSDESEAELQRQAVERAALLEQNRMEEAEFRLARQQLAHVDLRPPHAWTTGVGRKALNLNALRG